MIEVLYVSEWLKLKQRITNEERYWKEKSEFLINEGRGVAGVTGKRMFTIDVGSLNKEDDISSYIERIKQQIKKHPNGK